MLDVFFFLGSMALLGVLLAFYFVSPEKNFHSFLHYNPLRRFILTMAASMLDTRWKQLEWEVRLTTTYRRLYRRNTSTVSTLLLTHDNTALSNMLPAILRCNHFHAFVAFVATLADVLMIAVGDVPYATAQTVQDWYTCICTSMAILVLMMLTMPAIIFWRWQNLQMKMPRSPDTLLSIWMMLCNGSNGICEELKGYECMSAAESDPLIKAKGSRYWAGWITEKDGTKRLVIEKEQASLASEKPATSDEKVETPEKPPVTARSAEPPKPSDQPASRSSTDCDKSASPTSLEHSVFLEAQKVSTS